MAQYSPPDPISNQEEPMLGWLRGLSVMQKIMLPVSGLMSLAICVLAFYLHHSSITLLQHMGDSELNALAGRYGNQVKAFIEVGLDEVNALAEAFSGLKELGGGMERDEVVAMLDKVILSGEMFIGGSTGWEADAFDGRDREFVGTPLHDHTGRFLPYIYKEAGRLKHDILEGYDVPGAGDYYLEPKRRGKAYVVPPYLYRVGSENVLMTSTCAPVMVHGAFEGMFCLDIALSKLSEKINEIKPYGTGYAYLMTDSGHIVAHPVAEHVGRTLADILPDPAEAEAIVASMAQGDSFRRELDIGAGRTGILAQFFPIAFGDTGQLWYIAVCAPLAVFEADADRLSMGMVYMTSFTVGLLLIALFFVARSISLPVSRMVTMAREISGGNYRVRMNRDLLGGELLELTHALEDMAAKVETRETELKESENKYKSLLETSTDIIFRTDASGVLVFINANFEPLTGRKVLDLVGRHFSSLFPEHAADKARATFAAGLGGATVKLHEVELKREDGSTVPMELNLSIQSDAKGAPVGGIGIARDITERRRTERELRKYGQIIASSTDYISLIDRGGVIQAANNAFLAVNDLPRAAVIGAHARDIFGEDVYSSSIEPHVRACLAGMTVRHKDWVHLIARGRRYMDLSFFPCIEPDKTISGVVVNERDITEQKQLELQLQQAQKMEAIGTLAGGIAHDFNNILGGIIGYAEMIEMFDTDGNERLKPRVEHILKGAYRAKGLVEQILTFSHRAEQKTMPLKLAPLVREALTFLRATIPTTIQINVELTCPEAVVMASTTQIHQVMLNLCTNAAYAMKASGGSLTVSLARRRLDAESAESLGIVPGDYACLCVSDTGEGIDPAIASRIFDPFFTTKQTGDGTGMGLAVVHGVVSSLGGAVSFQSRRGQGSTFTIHLPLCLSEAAEEGREERRVARCARGRILFVDDEEVLVRLNTEMLSHLGYEVVGKTSSLEARELLLADPQRFDLVIVDQTMPAMTGYDLAVELLAVRPDIPVILCTGYSTTSLAAQASGAGIRYFLKKPAGVREIARIVSEALTG
jgi:PAS domain S-box-containing protein